jgi:ankyrin repeat domain-containing protein 50
VDRLTLQQSLELLVFILEGSSTTIIIDAIDELKPDKRWKLFGTFDVMLAQLKHANVKLFISNRDNGDIKSKLSQYTNIFIEATDNEEDIRKFVNIEVGKAILYYRILPGVVSDELKNDIITTLIKSAGGM